MPSPRGRSCSPAKWGASQQMAPSPPARRVAPDLAERGQWIVPSVRGSDGSGMGRGTGHGDPPDPVDTGSRGTGQGGSGGCWARPNGGHGVLGSVGGIGGRDAGRRVRAGPCGNPRGREPEPRRGDSSEPRPGREPEPRRGGVRRLGRGRLCARWVVRGSGRGRGGCGWAGGGCVVRCGCRFSSGGGGCSGGRSSRRGPCCRCWWVRLVKRV